MVCHEFKGGIGTASRVVPADRGGHTVGVLVQANYGKRAWLRVDGVPVGAEIDDDEVPSAYGQVRRAAGDPPPGSGSIIIVVATDAPLLPYQLERLAQRAGLGLARAGGTGGHTSGDLFIAFATGNRLPAEDEDHPQLLTYDVRTVGDIVIDALFDATIEATEEAIINALVAAETMTGRDGITAHALPHDRLLEVMTRYGRGPSTDPDDAPRSAALSEPPDGPPDRGDWCRLLDRDADQAAVLGPRPVVVADPVVAEQLVQDEPAVARPLADPAVRDDVLVGRDALRLVERGEILGALEGAVLLDGLGPRDRGRARDVPGPLGGLAHPWRGDDLAVEFGGRADVDQRELRVTEPRQDVVTECAQAEVGLGELVAGRRVPTDRRRSGPARCRARTCARR